MVGKRIPQHPLISEADACETIRAQTRRLDSMAMQFNRNTNDVDNDHEPGDVHDLVDVIVLTSRHRLAMFHAYPCSRDIKQLLASNRRLVSSFINNKGAAASNRGVVVVYVDGFDDFSTQAALSFYREGVQVFAREPRCW
jgi:hypothetical protein